MSPRAHRLARAPGATAATAPPLSAHDASDASEEWVRLPGLFSWDEVCALFSTESGHDDGWRFRVRRASQDRCEEALYTIFAARRPSRFDRSDRKERA